MSSARPFRTAGLGLKGGSTPLKESLTCLRTLVEGLHFTYKLFGFDGPVWMNLWSLMDGNTLRALGDPVLK